MRPWKTSVPHKQFPKNRLPPKTLFKPSRLSPLHLQYFEYHHSIARNIYMHWIAPSGKDVAADNLLADTATRVSAKPNPRSHLAGLLRSE